MLVWWKHVERACPRNFGNKAHWYDILIRFAYLLIITNKKDCRLGFHIKLEYTIYVAFRFKEEEKKVRNVWNASNWLSVVNATSRNSISSIPRIYGAKYKSITLNVPGTFTCFFLWDEIYPLISLIKAEKNVLIHLHDWLFQLMVNKQMDINQGPCVSLSQLQISFVLIVASCITLF